MLSQTIQTLNLVHKVSILSFMTKEDFVGSWVQREGVLVFCDVEGLPSILKSIAIAIKFPTYIYCF